MSYTQEIKTELCKIKPPGCCAFAECYGMLLFGRSFTSDNILFVTTSEPAAQLFSSLVGSCFQTAVAISLSGTKRIMYHCTVKSKTACKKIVNHYLNPESVGSLRDIAKKECCCGAFLRGAFISAGVISNPNSRYNLEFTAANAATGDYLEEFFKGIHLNPKRTIRRGIDIIYFRSSADIEACLTKMNAPKYALNFMEVEVYKDVRTRINRRNNCETANISKTVNASLNQRKKIEYLKSIGALQCLPAELVTVGELRINNPEMSLNELCEICPEKITRSGMYHRLQKLADIADKHLKKN